MAVGAGRMTTRPVSLPGDGRRVPGAPVGGRPGSAARGGHRAGEEARGRVLSATRPVSTLPRQRVSPGAALMVLAAVTGVVGMLAHAFGDAAAGLVWAVMR